ncbi:maltokinase N-terminal cap-like domain-containing protein [Tsukamurella soli]|uniref:Maltokinase n=1 Tax=Tsukamurella soli TaxID=644556 RepID=A0ABP8J8U9_9ACTN
MSGPDLPTDAELADAVARWLPAQRWFGAKTHAITGARVVVRRDFAAPEPGTIVWLLVEVELDGAAAQIYQVPLLVRGALPRHAEHALVPAALDVTLTDALADPDGALAVARRVAAGGAEGAIGFQSLRLGWATDIRRVHPLGVEQSNTSVVLDDHTLLKLFRRIFPGPNPDVEVTAALTTAGCPAVAPLLGSVDLAGFGPADTPDAPTTLAMVQEFAANASDGWQMALNSVRDLMAEGDLLAEEVGSDFAAETERLGEAIARVHADLAAALGTAPLTDPRARFAALPSQLDEAATVVPALARVRAEVAAIAEAAAREAESSAEVGTLQRIHGDLHLGQALRTPSGWLLVDFEGEPSASPAERRALDHPLRDVAGVLRSLDYAGQHPLMHLTTPSQQLRFRAAEWTRRNRDAFCTGYAEVAGRDPRSTPAVLRAFEVEKAVYETVYEAQNRPSWVGLPLRAIEALTAHQGTR